MGEVVAFPQPPVGRHRSPEPEPLWRALVGRELRAWSSHLAHPAGADPRRRGGGAAGISVQHLSKVERGLEEPSSEVPGAVHGALGLRLVDLTTRVSRGLRDASTPTGPLALAA